jgi:hypothetical protein
MGIKISGLDEMRRKLERLQHRAQNLSGSVPFEDLFPPEFMRRYTNFKTMEEMFGAFGTPINSTEDFERIPDDEWDAYVKRSTRFGSWEAMQKQAGEEYIERRLNLENI